MLSGLIEIDGTGKRVIAQRSLRPRPDQDAVEGVLKWEFIPAKGQNGKPGAMRVPIEPDFHF
jgi:hypothetical protein